MIALGSQPAMPDVPLDGLSVHTADDILRGARLRGSVIVFDDDGRFRGPGAALLLTHEGTHVEIVTPELYVGVRLDPSNLPPVYRQLSEADITLTPNHALVSASAGVVRFRNVFSGVGVERRGVDALVVSLLRRVPQDALYHALRGRVEVHLIGDAAAARTTDKVILEATVLGRSL